jgi:thiamine biosynthesis lipoprotein
MGTVVSFDVPAWAADGGGALGSAIRWLHWVDETFSTYLPASDVSRLGRGEISLQDCDPAVAEVLAACEELRERSGGYFTAYPAGALDPSGYVKGWAVERAATIITEAGSTAHTVNGGGDVQCVGGRPAGDPWRLGISDPFRPGALALVVAGRDFAIATSGIAERGAHIMNPVTALPAAGLASITILGPSLTTADAYATAAFAMGPLLAREWTRDAIGGYEAFAILPDGSTWHTPGLRDYLPAS